MEGTSIPSTLPAGSLDEYQAKQLLRLYDIPVVQEYRADDVEEAVRTAERIGFPVVLKGLGSALQHKTERGLVHLHLSDAQAVRRAAHQVKEGAGEDLQAFLLQPQVGGQRELMMGLFRDPQFGPVVLFGLGGTLTELLGDISMRLAPLNAFDRRRITADLRAAKLLKAFRGEAAVDPGALDKALAGLSRLGLEHPEIAEIDINPLRIAPDGRILAVDALVVVQQPPEPPPPPPAVAPQQIGALFYPRSIAFVGASAQLGKWGNLLVTNTISGGYQGAVHLVNPKGGVIAGRRAYRSLLEIPEPVDLAVVTVPAEKVGELILQCQAKGIRFMVLISSGFAETGAAGKALEARLMAAARQAGILILGPNTMGIANPHIRLYSTGTTVTPPAGSTVIVSQSGNMGSQLLIFADQQGIGIRGFSGSGNEAMITMADYLEGFEVDDQTRTVLIYVEGFKNGRRFFESARRVTRRKPVVLLKGGQTRAGQKAAASHSGAMSSDMRVFDALCRQTGIIRVYRPMDLLDLAAAFDSLPLPKGPRVAIMTFGGGWGVVTSDLCQRQGLELPDLDAGLLDAINPLLPHFWSHANPLDLVGDFNPEVSLKILELLMRWEGCDAVINLGIMGRQALIERLVQANRQADPNFPAALSEEIPKLVTAFEQLFLEKSIAWMTELQKPVIGVSLRADSRYKTVMSLRDARYKGVYYPTPERAVHALAKMVEYSEYLSQVDR